MTKPHPSQIPGKYRGTKHAAKVGYKTLIETGSALDAVEAAVRSMELSADFNAGYGSVLTRLQLITSYLLPIDKTNLDFIAGIPRFKWTRASWMGRQ